jgi:hypothetical protein
MLELQTSIIMPQAAHEVFAFISVPENMPQWRLEVIKYHNLPSGVVAVGQTWQEDTKHFGKANTATVEIVEVVEGQEFTIKTLSDSVPYYSTFRVEPTVEGALVSCHFKADLPLMLKLIEPMIKNSSIALLDMNFNQLKRLLENKLAA